MIIVKIFGGIGNQMFQYAAGRSLADLTGCDFKMDLSWYSSSPSDRNYNLNKYNIEESIASEEEIACLKRSGDLKIVKLFKKLTGATTTFNEKHFYYDPNFLSLKQNVYLNGYWQSEKYFKSIAHILRKEFQLSSEPSSHYKSLETKIFSTKTPVSFHFRRGDYIRDINSIHAVCPADYYNKCIDKIARLTSGVHIFVFSDDPVWVKDNINFNGPYTIVNSGKSSVPNEDLLLMSKCRHNIIANSSFSWWGAWLNSNPDKEIYAPKKWFQDSVPKRYNPKDIIPASWNIV